MSLTVRFRAIGLCICFMNLLDVGFLPDPAMAATGDVGPLTVTPDPAGGVHATATVLFPAPIPVIQDILTDYPKWPELFDVRMKVADVKIQEGVATTDLRIRHMLLPGERRLISESRALPCGGLVTDLKGGDFKRYHRVWKLKPAADAAGTEANFELTVEIDTMLPDWLVAMAVRQELDAHFRIVREKALARANREK